MIYTVTLNPALDYIVKVDNLDLEGVNRSREEHIFYGGKGINVSYILNELDIKSTSLGFVAGFTGRELERGVSELGIDTDFIEVSEGITRINVKIKADKESEINGLGPEITADDVDKLYQKLDKLSDGDILVLSGSIPSCMPSDTYEKILQKLEGRNIKVVVDATKDLLKKVLKYKPFLIKPNNHELAELFSVELKKDEDVVKYARKLQEMGAVNVLISMAGDGAILVDENDETHKIDVAKGRVVNSVGAGDSMVAGFLAGYIKTGSYEEALVLGTACGGATAFNDGLATRKDIEEILKQFK